MSHPLGPVGGVSGGDLLLHGGAGTSEDADACGRCGVPFRVAMDEVLGWLGVRHVSLDMNRNAGSIMVASIDSRSAVGRICHRHGEFTSAPFRDRMA